MKKQLLGATLFSLILTAPVSAVQPYRKAAGDCKIELKQDTLTIENSLIKRSWLWNNGNLITCKLEDKGNGLVWQLRNNLPDLSLPGEEKEGSETSIRIEEVPASLQYTHHLRATVEYKAGNLQVRKILKIYPDCPAIACELYLKGQASQKWIKALDNPADLQNIEKLTQNSQGGNVPVMEQLMLEGKHWQLEAVEFFDVTDRFNTLVRPVHALSYRDCLYRGNLLFAENTEKEAGFFMLKEAPTSNVQLYYPGGDYLVSEGTFRMVGLGVDSADIKTDEWTKAYSYVTGIFRSGEKQKRMALRNYQMRIRPFLEDRDEMVMLNTWGDRGQDTRVNEAFCLKELELAAKLGVTHFQIDDGWQAGRSANSAYGGSFKNIWDNPDYWTPDPDRFPNGLAPIVKRGKELGIEVCLWFNPSIQHDYADWQKDADALIALYEKYGIRTFKIDGTFFDNKLAESRLRSLYNRVMKATGWKAVLNLDATAGRRGGYFFFNEYGNIFLENRYTDWGNYYPYWSLRNLWMLSRYVAPQSLQIEFLNKWRNKEKYTGDKFAPSTYSFDYLFAITMAAQPLAWFEASNLPDEAFPTGEVIKKYKTVQHDFHTGYVFPVGDEPSGKSWCGFQSVKDRKGYFLLFRESNEEESFDMDTFFEPGEQVEFTPVLGAGKAFRSIVGKDGRIRFSLSKPNSYVLYSYRVL
ncbi:alpha-galactosidase [Parabacteroides johnsonii]|uniref:alpha-galactosidase n=1 Tax=Parabacteroides johnsonii TaxID=387661 RepID=UPI0011DDDBCB|nr:alpha-galactosidase [Parabacteroides johnsonii]MBP3640553.1 alpha-galactosidase [Parabacteroides sp.]